MVTLSSLQIFAFSISVLLLTAMYVRMPFPGFCVLTRFQSSPMIQRSILQASLTDQVDLHGKAGVPSCSDFILHIPFLLSLLHCTLTWNPSLVFLEDKDHGVSSPYPQQLYSACHKASIQCIFVEQKDFL